MEFPTHPDDEEPLPPPDVRFLDVHVEPWPDGRRVRVHVQLTPFQTRPNLQAVVKDPAGDEVCSANIIETMDDRFVFTLHLRGEPAESYNLEMTLFYDELGNIDRRDLSFIIPASKE
jgi:hypothetical protein